MGKTKEVLLNLKGVELGAVDYSERTEVRLFAKELKLSGSKTKNGSVCLELADVNRDVCFDFECSIDDLKALQKAISEVIKTSSSNK